MQTQEIVNAKELERRFTRFTNIDIEAFTHSYEGISTTLQKGKSIALRATEAQHLATHLARKILSREKKAKGEGKTDQVLWLEKGVDELMARMITPLGEDVAPEAVSREEAHANDVKDLQERFPEESPKRKEEKPVEKADVIEDLKSRGVDVDVNKSKEELLQDLIALEAQGK